VSAPGPGAEVAKLIGTAGHVDHGKTSLIQALTGIDADRLPDEKRRGMTIDIGFAYLDLPGVGRVSIVDVPGHERFLSNMLVGALGTDVALLCVAADESVMPQTREHLAILDLLPVQRLVVALTRSDLATPDMIEIVREEIAALVAETHFREAPTVAVSARTGAGIDELRQALAEALQGGTQNTSGRNWYLPIDRVFTVKGHGCVVTGTLAGGTVAKGDAVQIEPGAVQARVRGIQIHEVESEKAEPGMRVALNLSGVKAEDLYRGQAAGAPGVLQPSKVIDAHMRRRIDIKHGERVRVAIGADEAIGRIFLNDQNPELVQLRLEREIACTLGQPLILRRYSPPDLLGGGRISAPIAKPRGKREAPPILISQGSEPEAVLAMLSGNMDGVPTEAICQRLGRTPQALGDMFERLLQEQKVVGFAGLWFEPAAFRQAVLQLQKALGELHAANPRLASIPRDQVVAKAGLRWSGKPLERVLAALASKGIVRIEGSSLRDPAFSVQLTPRQREFLGRAIEALGRGRATPPPPHELARELGAPIQAVEEILRLGVEAGELVRVGEGIYFTPRALASMVTKLRVSFSQRMFSTSEAREALGTTRKYAIPLLEYWDARRVTMRQGDQRRLVDRD
jgi:selenocysteine-specific elongation factor